MDAIEDLALVVEGLERATSFAEAADYLARWAAATTGGRASFLRLLREGEAGDAIWAPIYAYHGTDDRFLRDETMIDAGECLCGRVLQGRLDTSQPFATPGGSFVWHGMQTSSADLALDSLGCLRGRCVEEGYESVAIFPLLADGQTVGALHVADVEAAADDPTTRLVETACRVAGGLLQRYRRQEREHSALHIIQSALLPPTPARIPGLEIGLSFESATDMAHIGGDFYDVLDLGAAGTLLFVGDYSGKGVEAAGMATRVRFTLANLALSQPTLTELLTSANQVLMHILPTDTFVTLAACRLSPDGETVSTALAGHPPPLVLRRGPDHPTIEEIAAPSRPPLGVFDDTSYVAADTRLADDVLLLYTDGIIEARRDGDLLGTAGIEQIWFAQKQLDLGELAEAICQESVRFNNAARGHDDRLALAVRRTA